MGITRIAVSSMASFSDEIIVIMDDSLSMSLLANSLQAQYRLRATNWHLVAKLFPLMHISFTKDMVLLQFFAGHSYDELVSQEVAFTSCLTYTCPVSEYTNELRVATWWRENSRGEIELAAERRRRMLEQQQCIVVD